MKKVGLILSIIGVLAVVAVAVVALIIEGATFAKLNYVRISVNPIVEFCLKDDKVATCYPVNEEAKDICAQEQFVGLNIEDAVQKYIDLCLRAGYISLSANNNAIGIEVASSISYALENKVYDTINSYLKNSQVLGLVLEMDLDNTIVRKSKALNVSPDKYMLMQSASELYKDKKIKDFKKYSEEDLIKLIMKKHKEYGNPYENYTEEQLINKHVLLDFNRTNYAKHMEAITDESLREFAGIYTTNQKILKKQYREDFTDAYDLWRSSHLNYVA